ncbi:MAG: Peptidyl-tRNA hydrolase ArfB [Planctomycetes bacterium ADurb.Bin412]|nr:MAG: Peptidyl-tRNA hydrolase ArfB [Planctomycetes bacterium ADurb.Bin412]
MLQINDKISIEEKLIQIKFVRSSGPGGQNVNKVNTCAQLRFDLKHCEVLAPSVKNRLKRLAGTRLTSQEVIQIESDRYREQSRNRQDCLDRLRELIQKALIRPKKRIATKPTKASRQRRLDAKKQRSRVKSLRGRPEVNES